MDVTQELWDSSAEAWIVGLEQDISRLGLLDVRVISTLGDVEGKSILDVGCGEGRLCRMLQDRGATCTGIDPTQRLIDRCRELDPAGNYLQTTAEEVGFEEAFDWAVFYISLVDIPDIQAAAAAAARSLKPGGAILNVSLNPFVTTLPNPWVEDVSGKRVHIAVQNYPQSRPVRVGWRGIDIINFHRPFEETLGVFIQQKLILESHVEPLPTPEELAVYPRLADMLNVPLFHIQVWRKPHATHPH